MKPENNKKTIILADDHEILLNGLTELINKHDEFSVVDVARNGKELIEAVDRFVPDICLVDLDMPIMNGLQAAEMLLKKYHSLNVIILTMHKEKSILKRIKALGIKGYLLKTCDSDELFFALNQVSKGKTFYAEEVSNEGHVIPESEASGISRVSQLTNREREIIRLLCEGMTNNSIAESLCISASTVDNHRTSIMKKLGVHNAVELTRFCVKHNLI